MATNYYGLSPSWEPLSVPGYGSAMPVPQAAATVAKASAPSLLSSIPGWVNPAAAGVSLAGSALGSFLQYQQAEDAERQRKKEFEEGKRQADRAAAFQERQYSEGAGVRAANMANQTFPALEKGMDWRARLAFLERGA